VTEPAVTPRPARTSWLAANVVLIVVALVLVAASVFWFKDGAAATPGDSRAETLSHEYKAVTKAANDLTLAFLTVDYKNMDPLIAKVLGQSTGNFKSQYEAAKVNLKASAQASQAVSSGKVLSIGVGDIDDSDAVVFVAADSQVQNKSTQGKAQPRYYRLKLSMTHKGDKWLASNLEFVG
jgi:Mce-associated membrane protein